MTVHKHYFKCPQCSQISSFVSSREIPVNLGYESSCYCGIMTHKYIYSKKQWSE